MKQSPQQQRIIERMAPGVLCREGFLGAETRQLWEILQSDDATVRDLGLSHQQIAEVLERALAAAIGALGRPVEFGRGLRLLHREGMGRIACPWGGCGVFPKGEVELTAPAGRVIRFTQLSIHMIAEHGFYQGRGGRYRLEPEQLAGVLNIQPE